MEILETKIFRIPTSQTGPNDFGLSSLDFNRGQAHRLLAGPHKVLHADDRVILGISTHASTIEIFLVRKTETTVTYYLRSEVAELEKLGHSATQVAVWRRAAPGLVGGTSGIIFNLLDEYDAVVSQPTVSPAGQRYWIDRMAEAEANGMTVGLVRGGDLDPFPNGDKFREWLNQATVCGDETFNEMRYYISKKPLVDQ